ncbi:methylaspartate mutase [Streptomyces sp. NPDC050732]|uniref:methylaspartate mutase n=1 Tax=Streptomyces sp. NPDC050732 TaxID=3154632 RepID=UPI003428DD2A
MTTTRTSGFAAYVAEAKNRNELIVQSRMGFTSPELMRAGLDAVRDAGPRVVGTITLDSFTRTGQFLRAGRAIAAGEALNGYPLVSHSDADNAQLLGGVDLAAFPVQVRHGSPRPQEIFRTMGRLGLTVSEGGPVSYCLPYSRVPLRESIDAWAEGCRILADGGRGAHLETFGGCMLGQLCPPGLLVALSVLECLFFAENGIRSVSLSYAQQTNPRQDLDAILALRALAEEHLVGVDWHVVLYTFMGVYPKTTGGATALLRESAELAAASGCERLIVKTTVESQRIPTIAENVAALRIAADAAHGVPRSARLPGSEVLDEASALINATLSLRDSVGDSLHEAFRLGLLDVPYCLHQDNRNRTRTSLDSDGTLRWASKGNMPLPGTPPLHEPEGAADRLLQMLSFNQHRFDAVPRGRPRPRT